MTIRLTELLPRPESDTLDFKATGYNLSNPDSSAALVKDIVCMAHTPREASAYIVTGVKKHSDGTSSLLGVTSHPDDADLQGQFLDRVYPAPTFRYHVLEHDSKQFGVFEISPVRVGPSVAVSDIGTLRQWQVYFRRQSRNTAATPEDAKIIYSWFEGTPITPRAAYETGVPGWQQLMLGTQSFDPSLHYVLVVSPGLRASGDQLRAIGLAPWSSVFDFDPNSDLDGLLLAVKQSLAARRSIHVTTLKEPPVSSLVTSTEWCFPRGLVGRLETLSTGKWLDWKRNTGAGLSLHVSRLASLCAPNPVTVIAVWEDPSLVRHLRSTLELFLELFGTSANIFILSSNSQEYRALAEETGAVTIDVPVNQFCSGLESLYAGASIGIDEVRFPSSSGAPITIGVSERRWLEEEFELVGLGAGGSPSEGRDVGRDFLCGNEISWYELGLHYDIDRDLSDRLQQQVRHDIEARRANRINLYHAPGAGGTTVGRRLLWNFHRQVPTLILRKTEPRHTIERLARVASLTGSAVLVLVDGAEVSSRAMDELYDLLRSQQVPIIMIQVLRRFASQSESARTFYLHSELSDPEAARFAHVFSRENPTRQVSIQQLANAPDRRFRTAFYFGLYTFLSDFRGLGPFVAQHSSHLNEIQREVIVLIAIAHHYAQKPFPAQAFADLLGLPPNKVIDVSALLQSAASLLIRLEDNRWRTAHDLIATELLQQLLSQGSTDRRLWKQMLSTWAVEFARICRGFGTTISDEMVEIVRRTFFYRDNTDLLGTERSATKQFAQLMEDIAFREGRLETLRQVTGLFPDEAHFWAHFGRFYGLEMKNHVEAGLCIDRAISLDPSDSTLYHMRGMSYRYEAYQLIDEDKDLSDVVALAARASECFARARQLNPDDDHGYISEVQMLIRVINYAGKAHDGAPILYLSKPTANPFLRDSLERSEGLLEAVRRHREGEGASPYEADCRARLDIVYGQHERALQVWDQLLNRSDVYAPPIRRQIVWTYLARRQRSWDELTSREADRVVSLLEQNLLQEPENDANLRLWIQAVRRSSYPVTLSGMIEKVSNWRTRCASLDATYYLYVLYSLQALDNVPQAIDSALRFLEESKSLARFRRDRHKSYEWLGKGTSARRLIHHSQLGEWNMAENFWENTAPLERLEGRNHKN
jgi:tetratricopeptide (TPR) repeat protein